jgi:hypothetical protein
MENQINLKNKAYRAWNNLKKRCNNPNNISFVYYGGRGIKVCRRWKKFENFIADMGLPPSEKHSIDRIDNDGNYEPSNCRWATREEQANNKSNNKFITYNDCTLTIAQWARKLNVLPIVIHESYHRLGKDLSAEQVLFGVTLIRKR